MFTGLVFRPIIGKVRKTEPADKVVMEFLDEVLQEILRLRIKLDGRFPMKAVPCIANPHNELSQAMTIFSMGHYGNER